MHSEQRQVLLDALENDTNSPVGRFEFAYILEEEKHWADSLREYQVAKRLAASVKGPMYTDLRGNAYDVEGVRREVDKAIGSIGGATKGIKIHDPESPEDWHAELVTQVP